MNILNVKKHSAMLLAAATLLGAQVGYAEITGGINYYNADLSGGSLGADYRLGLVGGSLGYKFGTSGSNFSLTPEIRAGAGIRDDKDGGISLEVERFYGLNLRAQWDLASSTYVFIAPSYTNFEVKASGFGLSLSDDEWEFGGGAGVGFEWSSNLGFELSYEQFDDVDVIGLGLRAKF